MNKITIECGGNQLMGLAFVALPGIDEARRGLHKNKLLTKEQRRFISLAILDAEKLLNPLRELFKQYGEAGTLMSVEIVVTIGEDDPKDKMREAMHKALDQIIDLHLEKGIEGMGCPDVSVKFFGKKDNRDIRVELCEMSDGTFEDEEIRILHD